MKVNKVYALIFTLFLMGTTVQAQTETRTPGLFTGVSSEGSWDVFITLGDKDEVRLVSKGFDLAQVITEVEDRKLEIKLKDDDLKNVNFTAYVTVRKLESISLFGSGQLMVQSDIKTNEFNIGLAGSGSIDMKKLTVTDLNVGMAGSGSIAIQGGSAADVNIGQAGSGNFQALALKTRDVKIGKTGSGDVSIWVDGELTVGSLGSGNVYYAGSPHDIDDGIVGSGKVIKKN